MQPTHKIPSRAGQSLGLLLSLLSLAAGCPQGDKVRIAPGSTQYPYQPNGYTPQINPDNNRFYNESLPDRQVQQTNDLLSLVRREQSNNNGRPDLNQTCSKDKCADGLQCVDNVCKAKLDGPNGGLCIQASDCAAVQAVCQVLNPKASLSSPSDADKRRCCLPAGAPTSESRLCCEGGAAGGKCSVGTPVTSSPDSNVAIVDGMCGHAPFRAGSTTAYFTCCATSDATPTPVGHIDLCPSSKAQSLVCLPLAKPARPVCLECGKDGQYCCRKAGADKGTVLHCDGGGVCEGASDTSPGICKGGASAGPGTPLQPANSTGEPTKGEGAKDACGKHTSPQACIAERADVCGWCDPQLPVQDRYKGHEKAECLKAHLESRTPENANSPCNQSNPNNPTFKLFLSQINTNPSP